MKYVRNNCYGGFGLSRKAIDLFNKYANTAYSNSASLNWSINRSDPNLIRVVEELGEEANDYMSELVIVDIPAGIKPMLAEYDGWERFEEPHKIW